MDDDDGRTGGRRTPDHGYTISSPCEPNGSGELKMYTPVNPSFTIQKWGVRGCSLHGLVFVMGAKLLPCHGDDRVTNQHFSSR